MFNVYKLSNIYLYITPADAPQCFLYFFPVNPNFYSRNLLYIGQTYMRMGNQKEAMLYLTRARDYPVMTPDDKQVGTFQPHHVYAALFAICYICVNFCLASYVFWQWLLPGMYSWAGVSDHEIEDRPSNADSSCSFSRTSNEWLTHEAHTGLHIACYIIHLSYIGQEKGCFRKACVFHWT